MPKRILYVHACAGLGGAPLSLLYLIEQLDRTRYEPEVLFIGTGGEEVELFRHRGIPVRIRSDISTYPHARNAYLALRSLRPWEIVTRALQILPSARRMLDELRSRPADLVHLNTSTLLPAGLGAARAGIPVVWHIREPLHPGFLGLRRWLVSRCIDRCSRAVIAISRFDAKPLVQSPKVHVVYNFVDFDRFNRRLDGAAFRACLGLSPDQPLVVMLGGLIATKGPDVFVEAAIRVRQKRPDVIFLVAGLPPRGESPSRVKRVLRRWLEASGFVSNVERRVMTLIHEHRLVDTVRFTGMRRDVPEMLAASTVLVWPATVSHFARPIIEAAAMGLPVVASDFPSSREILEDGTTGLLAAPRDPAAVAAAVLRLLEHPEEARRFGEAAYAAARARFDARRNAASIVSIYNRVLGGQATGTEA